MKVYSTIQKSKNWFYSHLKSLWEPRSHQIRALDGLRAFAITFVIAGHSKNDFIFAGGHATPASLFLSVGYLWIGVDLFFVLSGYLIGRILMGEVKKTGSIEVIPFLLKRGFRIWPLYYFICGLSLTFLAFKGALPKIGDLLPDFFFLTNYFQETLAYGTWSLSIEEQFYILAATLLFLFRKKILHRQNQIPIFLGFLLFIAPVIRILVFQHYSALKVNAFTIEWDILHNYLHTHYDGLAMGLLIASIQTFLLPTSFIRSHFGKCLWILSGLTLGLTVFSRVPFIYLLAALAFGGMVWHCLTKPMSLFSRFLSWPGFQIVSRLSYGMYLWYRFPLWRIAGLILAQFPGASPVVQYSLIFMLDWFLAATLAIGTYIFIERPFLELREQVFPSKKEIKLVRAFDFQ